MSRILSTLRAMADKNWTTVTQDFKRDVFWFVKYAESANGILYYSPAKKEIEIQCDLSLTGGGGLSGHYFYTWRYPESHTNKYPLIDHLEAINLLVAFRTLATLVRETGACIVMATDIGSSYAIQIGKTKDKVFADCAREMWLEALSSGHCHH